MVISSGPEICPSAHLDWRIFTTQVNASASKGKSSQWVVFNKQSLGTHLWVKLPFNINDVEFNKVAQIEPAEVILSLSEIHKEGCWLQIPFSILDSSSGSKLYAIECYHRKADAPIQLYFSFCIQDNNPAKPYDYMTKLREVIE